MSSALMLHLDRPSEYIDDMAHLLTSIESLSKPALFTLAKDHNLSGPYNLSGDSLQIIISTHLTIEAGTLSS